MDAPSQAPEITGGFAIPRPGRAAARFVAGTLLGVLLVLGGIVGFGQAYAGRILPGVAIGSVDVSGLTESQARASVEAALGRLEDGQITVRSKRDATVITFADVGRVVDNDAMIAAAMANGREGSRFDEALAGLRGLLRPTTIPVILDYDRERLTAALDAFADRSRRSPIDASVRILRFGYLVGGEVEGVQVDTRDVASAIDAALLDPSTPSSTEQLAESIAIPPTTSDADVERAMAAAERMAAPLAISKGSKTWKITRSRIRTWISFEGSGADLAPTIDAKLVPAALKAPSKALARKPTEARYLRDRAGRIFGVSASSAGRALDLDGTVEKIVTTLASRAAGQAANKPIKVKTIAVAPKLTTGEATRKAPLVSLLGSWTTYYQVSAHNGFAANITVPARKLDGVVVRPGQLFDFWGALGEVSFRTGYRLGGAIVGGHSVEGKALAGGICSASTTLFNAAARSGLQIVTRSAHWYYISRYPLGLDATVSGSQSMRFRNDTKHPILIKTYASPGVVTFQIWSVPNGRSTTWSRPHVENVVRGYDTVQYTSSLPPGQRKRIEWPVDGKDVWVTRTVRDGNGRVVHRETFVSHYHRMVGVTLIGR
ncbi:MAG TPA: VanW family protein [Candidatus Limnocylindrales bacterium]|nr:VanW family protein [Candidatus Limnocylindrales bacterium]